MKHDLELKPKRAPLGTTVIRNTEFRWGEHTYIMGVCNLSPDSFSGDGLGNDIEATIAQARQFVADGADIIDVGGESTRPGKDPRPTSAIKEELQLVIPVMERLAREIPVPISIDTYKSEVARQAIKAGANMINDIWGLKQDPRLAQVAAASGVPIVLMSNQRGAPADDIMPAVISTLEKVVRFALEAGVLRENIIIDPGIGFGKTLAQNLEIIYRLSELRVLGQPILLGTSRKSMIGLVLDLPVDQRLEGTAATVAIGIANGADMIRVHDVQAMVRVARMSDAIVRRTKH